MQPEYNRHRILERLQHHLKVSIVRNHSSALVQRGLSIVEMLVGIAVGLFIVAGTTKLFVDYLGSNRNLLLETRVNQDLRAAADLVVRDLRRASYWRNSTTGISTNPTIPPVANPYAAVAYASGALTYSYDKDGVNGINATTEDFGVRRDVVSGKGVLQLRTAGGWQTITDPGTLDIPASAPDLITPTTARVVDLWDECPCIFEGTCRRGQFQALDPDPGAIPGPGPLAGGIGVWRGRRRIGVVAVPRSRGTSAARHSRGVSRVRRASCVGRRARVVPRVGARDDRKHRPLAR